MSKTIKYALVWTDGFAADESGKDATIYNSRAALIDALKEAVSGGAALPDDIEVYSLADKIAVKLEIKLG